MEAATTEESPVLLTTCALFPALSLGKINRCCDSPNSIRVGIPMSVFPVSRSIPRHRRPQETTSFLFLGQTSPELDNAVFMILKSSSPKRNVLVPQGRVSTDALYPACDSNTQKHLSLSRPRKAQYSSRILPPSAAAALAMNAPTSIANAVAIDTRAACFLAASAICRNFCCESFN